MRIDPHVHFRDGIQSYKETIAHGLAVATSQGVDKVVDMPNCYPHILRREHVIERLKLVPESEKGRYYMYIGSSTDPKQLAEAVACVKEFKEVVGIKMFAGKSTGDLQILSDDEQRFVYQTLTDLGYEGLLAAHCELEALMDDSSFDPKNPISHARARPPEAEVASIKNQIAFIKETGFKGHFHMVHVSVPESVDIVTAAKKEGMRITCAATPHHLMWDESKYEGELGLLYKMNPCLRAKELVDGLREHLVAGRIDWIETDHAPHAVGEKLKAGYPSGYPTLYVYKECVEEFLPSLGISEERIKELTYDNIIKVFDF